MLNVQFLKTLQCVNHPFLTVESTGDALRVTRESIRTCNLRIRTLLLSNHSAIRLCVEFLDAFNIICFMDRCIVGLKKIMHLGILLGKVNQKNRTCTHQAFVYNSSCQICSVTTFSSWFYLFKSYVMETYTRTIPLTSARNWGESLFPRISTMHADNSLAPANILHSLIVRPTRHSTDTW